MNCSTCGCDDPAKYQYREEQIGTKYYDTFYLCENCRNNKPLGQIRK